MLQVESLSKSFGDRVLFQQLSFSLERGQKVGLIAPNGSGKTTLMNILVGVEPYDEGLITYEDGVRWAYLPQLPDLPTGGTILEACFSRFDPVAQLTLQWQYAVQTEDTGQMERLLPQMEASGAWHYEQRAKEILGALGIRDQHRQVANCSGGEAKRIALAATLISDPDLLFLDEPTNHLDLQTIEWLEDYLSRSTMSLVLITHDRYFLDRVCNEILEIDLGQIYRYKGGYDYYLDKREERLQTQAANVDRARNLYRRELDWMRRQPQARGGKARYRIEAFHELEKKIRPARRGEAISLAGTEAGYIGKKIFEAHGVCKAYGDKVILRDFEYIFSRHDKIGIVGENGVGKTTFLRMLLGQEPTDAGHFDIGQTVRFGYYSQQAPSFDPESRVIDVVKDIAEVFTLAGSEAGQKLSASQILTQFLFPPERQYTQISKLSGGELRRLYLCTVLVTNPNFLILDEPTNDLDILTLQVLEEYLVSFAGCVLIVSHDRFFMDKVVEHLLCFEGDGWVRDFPGNYSLYRAYKENEERERQCSEARAERKEAPSQSGRQDRPRTAKLTYAEKRELESIEVRMPELEAEKKALEEAMSLGTMTSDELVQAANRIGGLIDEMDLLALRQLELEEKIS
ncbi:ABC-F family ATP-binding cassette domain-containing protein [Porphyromonas sp. COT-290 OH3588]|uniref:ABC-F family ATP-binding cassette domain-containing protein n=1 Tax=Porphyromonas sp. COT-290 OH3588 TaxID=1515617 RepID=UPI00052B79D6|nr:ABC-F family ATP-binding cassette domain-containing protein [Porphyromonas sp. COT-290 OH3588]KGO00946.1 ABC transporter [Porphyromonas sp. COT-290 OH3588]